MEMLDKYRWRKDCRHVDEFSGMAFEDFSIYYAKEDILFAKDLQRYKARSLKSGLQNACDWKFSSVEASLS